MGLLGLMLTIVTMLIDPIVNIRLYSLNVKSKMHLFLNKTPAKYPALSQIQRETFICSCLVKKKEKKKCLHHCYFSLRGILQTKIKNLLTGSF